MLISEASSKVRLYHQEADILSPESSWNAVWFSSVMGCTHPWDSTELMGSGIVETTLAVSLPAASCQSTTERSNPEDSGAMYPTVMLRGLSLV